MIEQKLAKTEYRSFLTKEEREKFIQWAEQNGYICKRSFHVNHLDPKGPRYHVFVIEEDPEHE